MFLHDVGHRVIAALISLCACFLLFPPQPLQSLSLADSKLKTEVTIIINALGSNTSLTKVDISGNSMGDMGAKMLAKALQINTKLRYMGHVLGPETCMLVLRKAYKELWPASVRELAVPEVTKLSQEASWEKEMKI